MVDCKECKNYNICEIRKMVEGKLQRCQSFEQKKPQSQADRIRAMSDEELAELLNKSACDYYCNYKSECTFGTSCKEGILEGLKSEAKE